MRVGIGWDVHRLVNCKTKSGCLILGGIKVPFNKKLEGYSDADVLTHAVIDAILGAAGLFDIGFYFPTGDNKYRGISSMKLLEKVKKLIKSKKLKIVNIDSVIIAQKPKLSPFTQKIAGSIANVLSLPLKNVNVKSKTEDNLGYIGKGKAIAAYAVCLVKPIR